MSIGRVLTRIGDALSFARALWNVIRPGSTPPPKVERERAEDGKERDWRDQSRKNHTP